MEDPKPNTCDWSSAASESAAQVTASLKAFGISKSKPAAIENGGQLPSRPGQLQIDTADSTMSPPSDVAAKYFWERSNGAATGTVPVRRIQSDVPSTPKRELGTEVNVVRPSQSMDQAFTKKRLDKYGFIINMDDQGNLHDDRLDSERIPTYAETKLIERREQKWNGMLSSWDKKKKRRKKLLKRLRKGVPDSLRGKVWCQMGNVPQKIKVEKKGYYDELVIETTRTLSQEDDENFDAQERASSSIPKSFRATQDTIERDIHRTFPRHHLFHEDSTAEDDSDDEVLQTMCDEEVSSWIAKLENHSSSNDKSAPVYTMKEINPAIARGGQASLRRVLRAYSYHDAEVGYCQGMNFIAAMFLTFMSEEEAFWLLVAVMNDPPGRMRGMFGRDMQAAHQVLYVADKLIQQFLPKLAKHLEAENIHITMYATQWVLTIYTSSFQFDLVTRVWDCFLAEGWKVVYRVMLALMTQSQPDLLVSSFEEILAYFRDLPEKVVGDRIMETAMKIPLKRKHIVKYEKEWLANNPQS